MSDVISIGVNLEYEKELNKMMSAFESKLNKITDELGKTELTKDLQKQINNIVSELGTVRREMSSTFDQLSKGKLDVGALTNYKQAVTQSFNAIDGKISELAQKVAETNTIFDGLNGKDFSSNIISQYNAIKESASETADIVAKISEFVAKTGTTSASPLVPVDQLEKYDRLKSVLSEISSISKSVAIPEFKNEDDAIETIYKYADEVDELNSKYTELIQKKKEANDPKEISILESEIAKLQARMVAYQEAIVKIDMAMGDKNPAFDASLFPAQDELMDKIEADYKKNVEAFKADTNEFLKSVEQASKASSNLAQINTFQVKNGAIHVPVELTTSNKALISALQERIDALQNKAIGTPVIIPVKLRIDSKDNVSATTIKAAEQELKNTENMLATGDVSKTLDKTMKQATQQAWATVRAAQKIFNENPVKLVPDANNFKADVETLLKELPNFTKFVKVSMDASTIGEIENLRNLLQNTLTNISIQGLDGLKESLDGIVAKIEGLSKNTKVPVILTPVATGFAQKAKEVLATIPDVKKTVKLEIDTKTMNQQSDSVVHLANALTALSTINVKEVASALRTIGTASGKHQAVSDLAPSLSALAEALEKIKPYADTNFGETLKGLNVSSKAAENINNVTKALDNFYNTLSGKDLSNADFLKQIESILQNAQGLNDLSSILKSSISKIESAGNSSGKLSQLPAVIEEIGAASQTSSNQTRQFSDSMNQTAKSSSSVVDMLKAEADAYAKTNGLLKESESQVNVFDENGLNVASQTIKYYDDTLKETYQTTFKFNTATRELISVQNKNITNFKKQAEAAQKMGEAIPNAGQYKNIQEVYNNLSSIFAESGRGHLVGGTNLNEKTGVITAQLQTVEGQIKSINVQLDKNGFAHWVSTGIKQTSLLKDAFGGLYTKMLQIFAYKFTPTAMVGYFRQGLDVLKEYDSALTTISYTMNISDSQLKSLGKDILQLSNDLNTSVENAMSVAQIYANMNTSAEEIKQLSTPTIVLSNLTGMDASTAADEIQAVVQQFDMLASDSAHIVDVYDKISSSIAVDYSKGIQGMAGAVQVAGASAKAAGLDFEQLSAIVAKTQEKTRAGGEQVGNALKTIFTRLSKASNLDDTIDNETLSNASKALHNVGVEVYNADGSFRQFDVIMGELAKKWDTLSDAEQANISYQVAATRQSNILKSVLNSWTDAMELATEATNANGNAMENQEKYADSYAGRLQALQTAGKTFWVEFLDDDAVKGFISLLTELLTAINKVVDATGFVPSALGIGALIGGFNVLKIAMKESAEAGVGLGQVLSDKYWANSIFNIGAQATAHEVNATATTLDSTAQLGLLQAEAEETVAGGANTTGLLANTKAVLANAKAKMAAKTASAGLLAILVVAAAAWVGYEMSVKKAVKDLKESTDAFKSTASELDSLNDKLSANKDRIQELNDLKKEGTFSIADQDEIERINLENEGLREQISLLQQRKAEEAKQVIKDQSKIFNRGTNTGGKQYSNIIKEFDSRLDGATGASKASKDLNDSRISQLSSDILALYDSYKLLEEEGIAIVGEDKKRYDQVTKLRQKYLEYIYTINKTKDAYLALNAAQKRSALITKLTEKGLSDAQAKDAVSVLSDEELDIVYDAEIKMPDAKENGKEWGKEWVKNAQKSIDATPLTIKVTTDVDALSDAQSLGKGLDILSGIYEDVKNKEGFDYSSILNNDDFSNAFSQYEAEYQAFVKTIADSPNDINACQEAFNDLATAYINGSDALVTVTEETKDATTAMLKQMGVANAEEVVQKALANSNTAYAQAKRIAANSSKELADYTAEDISQLKEEGIVTEEVGNMMALLAVQEKIANNALDSSRGCQELLALAEKAGIATDAIAQLAEIMANITLWEGQLKDLADGKIIASSAVNPQLIMAKIQKAKGQAEDLKKGIQKDIASANKVDYGKISFTGGSSTGKDSSSKSGSDSAETFDWVDRAIQKVEKEIDRLDDKASDTWRSWSSRNGALSDELGKVQQQMGQMAAAADYYMQKANAIPLPDYYKNLVMNGGLLIEEIQDETLKKNIKEFQELYMLCNCYLVIGNNKYYLTAGKS